MDHHFLEISQSRFGSLPNAKLEIQEFLHDFAETVRYGNINEIMGFYARDIVAFDMMPPLKLQGADRYRKVTEEYFTENFQFPLAFNYYEQQITASGDIGMMHSLLHINGKMKTGKLVDNWLRSTLCLKRTNAGWKITHQHNSVPIDGATQKGLMDLSPNDAFH